MFCPYGSRELLTVLSLQETLHAVPSEDDLINILQSYGRLHENLHSLTAELMYNLSNVLNLLNGLTRPKSCNLGPGEAH